MKQIKTITTRTAGELAAALNLPTEEGVELDIRWQLQKKIAEAVRRSGMTHAQVAEAAGTSRTRLTALLNGTTEHISTDLMLRILAALGYSATLTFRRRVA